ncbi:VCBS repeat-containing protein [Verrucomicrobia bacterium]|nr:VCBS repeat-containing protein [Verrucomicrobiota bacterium]
MVLRGLLKLLSVGVFFVTGGCGPKGETNRSEFRELDPNAEIVKIDRMVAVEQLILELTPKLKLLADSLIESGSEISKTGPGLFDEDFRMGSVAVTDPKTSPTRQIKEMPVRVIEGELATMWSEIFRDVQRFNDAHFYFVDGNYIGPDLKRFESNVGFEGKGVDANGSALSIKGKIHIGWNSKKDSWEIEEWKFGAMQMVRLKESLFKEVLKDVILDQQQYERAVASLHEENVIDLFTRNKFSVSKQVYADYLDLDSTFQHPGLSVVDYNKDGWDDLYLMGRWGANQMFRNNADGTFTDVAKEIGLDIKGLCNCATFADFDNDGDPDVFIGRSLERSLYLENESGRYVDRTKEACGSLLMPYLVSTISAVDYNQDGLLDVYLGLYGPPQKSNSPEKWVNRFFPENMAKEILKRLPQSHRYINRLGPPNLLLVNRGKGHFSVAPESSEIAEWHSTYQSVWSDFDQDGDPDVYICNDFAPDHLYRNEGPRSSSDDPRFVDVTKELAGDSMQGFGMGASWGDYDRDGKLDLYVSNMFSKAGRRITRSIEGLDPRVPYSAQGNLLFRNESFGFEQVAGVKAESVNVAKVGWAYGAQFVDVDNDGWLDIYSASGFYTAPEQISTENDL